MPKRRSQRRDNWRNNHPLPGNRQGGLRRLRRFLRACWPGTWLRSFHGLR